MPLQTAQRIFGFPGQVNSVQIVVDDRSDAARTRAALLAAIPPELRVQAPCARGERACDDPLCH